MVIRAIVLLSALLPIGAQANYGPEWSCWSQASAKHGVPEKLLLAIAEQESGFNPKALGGNTNGSQDIGMMQINTWWLAKNAPLGRMGIKKQDLLDDPCLNVHIGAWVLKQNFERFGYDWRAVGAYNASTEYKRVNYANKIHKRLKRRQID